jgi:histidinol phosphatase-like enzyme
MRDLPHRHYSFGCYHRLVDTTLKSSFPDVVQAVFLDREGVVNEKMPEGCYVTCWDEFQILSGVVEAIRLLNQARIRVIVVSNQRGTALGQYTAEDVRVIHEEFQNLLQAEGGRTWMAFSFALTTRVNATAANLCRECSSRLCQAVQRLPRPAA